MSNELPSGQSLLVRTDFSDDERWHEVSADVQAIQHRSDGSEAQGFFTVVDDRTFDGVSPDELFARTPSTVDYMFIIDDQTLSHLEHPVLVAGRLGGSDPVDNTINSFRAVPGEVASIENNLSIGNLGFDDYQPHLDDDGIYRGLPAPPPQRFVGVIELVEASAKNVTTPALSRFHRILIKMSSIRRHQVTEVADVRRLHDAVLANDYTMVYELVGYDEFVQATEAGGPALTLHLDVPQGYWEAVLDPGTLVPRAAMLVQGRLPARDVHTTNATVRSWHKEGRFGVLDAPEMPGGCRVTAYSIVDVYGTSNFELREGQQVEVDYVANTGPGIPNAAFRAVEVRLQN